MSPGMEGMSGPWEGSWMPPGSQHSCVWLTTLRPRLQLLNRRSAAGAHSPLPWSSRTYRDCFFQPESEWRGGEERDEKGEMERWKRRVTASVGRSESKREKGRLGKREEGENRGKQTPTRRWTETLHTWRDWERQRERESVLRRQREAERGEKKEGAWKGMSQRRQKRAGREMTAQGSSATPPEPALPTYYLTCQEII